MSINFSERSWKKMGLIYKPGLIDKPWAVLNSTLPTPFQIDDNTIRIYMGFGTSDNVSSIGYIDVEASDPLKIKKISTNPVLSPGESGEFDDNGVVPISLVKNGNELLLYYVGFQLGVKVRYYLFSGVAISRDNGETFTKLQSVPILDRSHTERFIRTAPCVMKDGDIWRMWYLGGNSWIEHDNKQLPLYDVKYVESESPFKWPSKGQLIISNSKGEHGFGRPFIFNHEGLFYMFYSIRFIEKGYRLGYAISKDGNTWLRKDDFKGLEVSESGWDSEMICFGAPIFLKDKILLFYNGNQYGQSGMGYAEFPL